MKAMDKHIKFIPLQWPTFEAKFCREKIGIEKSSLGNLIFVQ